MRYDSRGGAKAIRYGVKIKKPGKKNPDKLRESKQENIQ